MDLSLDRILKDDDTLSTALRSDIMMYKLDYIVTNSFGYTLYCACFNLFCNVRVYVCVCVCVNVGFVMCGCGCMCGCFGNMYTCIYCVLYCLYCVFVLFRLCIFIISFVCTSVSTTATE